MSYAYNSISMNYALHTFRLSLFFSLSQSLSLSVCVCVSVYVFVLLSLGCVWGALVEWWQGKGGESWRLCDMSPFMLLLVFGCAHLKSLWIRACNLTKKSTSHTKTVAQRLPYSKCLDSVRFGLFSGQCAFNFPASEIHIAMLFMCLTFTVRWPKIKRVIKMLDIFTLLRL